MPPATLVRDLLHEGFPQLLAKVNRHVADEILVLTPHSSKWHGELMVPLLEDRLVSTHLSHSRP